MEEKKQSEIEEEENFVYDQDAGNDAKAILEKLHKKLKECREEKQKYLDGWQRIQADFANFKRRNEQQIAEWSKTLGEGVIKDILPVLDSLDAAIASGPDDRGLLVIKNQLQTVLKKHGLEEIRSVKEKFNPQYHEVVECEEVDNENSGEIVSGEIQKGYTLNGKVIRAAKVKVKK
ncbi:MAG: nucleotide exchange factor GrpE [Candidatus Portnoybacteria bacterium RBG_19FT_COMBO_36_7]|uniref:Protein GrpE n=1 Tax=Candidatus Portnoybacteria bacterium RBG_19FT_COMBO_36_7 TaxID=1801992 RepID=A0A1G2FAN3_9BACT|nr:MAG: nucleotide exchange factor GrpE [Candidatus Portnoybacteria bacterium RBG_19FT_COMBO_36_7]